MAERKSLDGLTLTTQRGGIVLALEAMEIWDGADLSLLRDGLNHVILQRECRSVAVDMSAVKYVPSGFFGMLFDWFEQGVTIRLVAPQQRVRDMLWFRQFFTAEAGEWFICHDGFQKGESAVEMDEWQEEEWQSDAKQTVVADH